MKLVPVMLRSVNDLSRQCWPRWMIKAFSMNSDSGDAANKGKNSSSFETADDFERRIFSEVSANSPNADSFYQKLDQLEKARGKSGTAYGRNAGDNNQFVDGLDESFNTLSDGMDGKLKKAATYFTYSDEIKDEDYAFRPDVTFLAGMTYTTRVLCKLFVCDGFLKSSSARLYTSQKPLLKLGSRDFARAYTTNELMDVGNASHAKSSHRTLIVNGLQDLDLTKPGIRKSLKRAELDVTTEEVLRKADFRNVRFLANFITEAGIIIKRSKTRISAKAQRKVAREIKTARAFGLMPFTTMGTKPFVFGKTMEDLDEDYEFHHYNARVTVDTREGNEPI